MSPAEERDFDQQLRARITIATFELNLALRAAAMTGLRVDVDTAERDGWTEILAHLPLEGEDA